MSNTNVTIYKVGGGEYCDGDSHMYPTMYSGDPEYADQFFNTCLCGKKRRITIIKEVDVQPLPELEITKS